MSALERGRILMRFSELVAAQAEALAALEAKDVGKVIKSTRFDVGILARYLEFYGTGVLVTKENADEFYKTHIESEPKIDFNDLWGRVTGQIRQS